MPATLKRVAARIVAFFRRDDLDHALEDELALHFEMEVENGVLRGLPPDEARRQARIKVGNPAALVERHRVERGLPGLDTCLQDLRFAVRLIAKERWFSAGAIAAIALGIGANAAGFSLVNSVFLRGLPFEDSDRLYVLTWQLRNGRRGNVSLADLQDWRARSTRFEGIAGVRAGAINISDDVALAEPARGSWVTANTFDLLRQRPVLGRSFVASDERVGAIPVAMIGESLWHSRYGSDPAVVGRTLRVNGTPTTIIGVMPASMRFPDNSQVWLPYGPSPAQRTRTARVLAVFGRLKTDTNRQEAAAELSAIGAQLLTEAPESAKDLTGAIRVETFTERSIGGSARPMFYAVMGAVVFVLLIACANVANLLLARAGFRSREIAMRAALGASRGRIIRQLLTESLVISGIGGVLGLFLAMWGVALFDAAMPPVMPFWITFDVDYRVFAYVAGTCVLTTMLFGLAPALHLSRAASRDALKEGGRGVAGSRRTQWFSGALVVVELVLTVVLLAGAGLMIRSFVTLYRIDLGIDAAKLLAVRVQLPESPRYRPPEARRDFFGRLEPRLAAVPGVEAVAVTNGVPPHDGGERYLEIDRPPALGEAAVMVGTVTITPGFFDAVGVHLLRGRSFHDGDGAPGAETVIVNERLARQFFPGEDPIGRRLRFSQRDLAWGHSSDIWRTIVGVSPAIGHGSAEDRYANAVVYVPYRQEVPASVSLLLRTNLPPGAIIDAVRREVLTIDRDQPVFPPQTAAQIVDETQWWYRVWGGVFGVIAAIALTLSSVGLYAVVAYAVTQRTQEIGVRMAIGAQPWQIAWMMLRRGLAQLAVGVPLGLGAAVTLSRTLWPGGVGPIPASDRLTFAAITVFLAIVAIAACLVPARRAARVDPMQALRSE